MTASQDDLLDERLYQQYCFACGHHNPLGLRMRFRRDGADGVVCDYTPRPEHRGFPGAVHGGVLVALLDESMAWAMFAAHRALGMTAKMETRYRRPVPPEIPLTIRARVARSRGRRIEVDASIEDARGDRLVETTALFLRLPAEQESRMLGELGWDLAGPHLESGGSASD
jgi:acyl-coenzyme A thioesterase PaaI-like protein